MTTSSKSAIVKQVAHDLYLREDVVETVLEHILSMVAEEIITTGKFHLVDVLTVDSHPYKGVQNSAMTALPRRRLTVRLSKRILKLFALHETQNLSVDRTNWRAIRLDEIALSSGSQEIKSSDTVDPDFNPFLDEDD